MIETPFWINVKKLIGKIERDFIITYDESNYPTIKCDIDFLKYLKMGIISYTPKKGFKKVDENNSCFI